MSTKTVVLTDVAENVWQDRFDWKPDGDFVLTGAADWSISKRTLRGGVSDGVDVVDLNNGLLSVSILPTRGMGLWRGSCKDVEIGWNSPVKLPVNPSFVNLTERSGLGWLSGFNEWLCRCGLSSHGAPGIDVVRNNQGEPIETPLTLHGKIANTPAHRVEATVATDGPGVLSVTGVVDEAMMFGSQMRLTSTIRTEAGSNRLRVIDEITNLSAQTAEMELLYHINMGRPFLEEGAKFAAPVRELAPRDTRAAEDVDSWDRYRDPLLGYQEQVYFMELLGDSDRRTAALLRNSAGDRGVSLHFQPQQLPCFSLWKNTQAEADGYVTGLEPATSFPNLKTYERTQGRLISLASGQSYRIELELAVHVTADAVEQVESEIQSIQQGADALIHRTPQPKFSPVD